MAVIPMLPKEGTRLIVNNMREAKQGIDYAKQHGY
jgi:hypothetical protein